MAATLKIGELYWLEDRGSRSEWTLFMFKGYTTFAHVRYAQGETIASTWANPADVTKMLIPTKDVFSFVGSLIKSQIAGKEHVVFKTLFSWNML